jgi:hypothetical protein
MHGIAQLGCLSFVGYVQTAARGFDFLPSASAYFLDSYALAKLCTAKSRHQGFD